MKNITNYLFIIFLFILSLNNANSLSIEEKVSNILWASFDIDQTTEITKAVKENIGGIQLLYGNYSLEKTREVLKSIYQIKRQTPPFIAIDYEGGSVYIHQTHNLFNLPSNMAIGRADDSKNTSTLFYLLGLELKKAGINTAFSPVLDVNTEIKNPIINVRSISSDTYKTTRIGELIIDGFKTAGIITTLKHFPGHGMTEDDSHLTLPSTSIDPITLYNIHIYPFKKMIENKKADIIMLSHILYKNIDPDNPASLSPIIIQKILREQLKYEGVIITDSMDMKAITSNYTIDKAIIRSINAGADMVLIGRYNFEKARKEILKAISSRKIDLTKIDKSIERINLLKQKYNLRNFEILNDKFDLAYTTIAQELAIKSIRIVKGKIDNLKNEKIKLLFFLPQRFSSYALIIYQKMKEKGYDVNLTIVNSDKIDIRKIEKNNFSTIIVFNYSWPWISEKREKLIIDISKEFKNRIFVNLLNPVDSPKFQSEFNTIVETYGINEFSATALSEILCLS